MAQIITFAIMPVITRIYTPDEFGLYSIFFSITTAIALISSFNYEQAIILPKSNKDAQAILFLSLIILLVMVIFSIILILIFNKFLFVYFEESPYLVWMIPLSVFILGLMQIFDAYSNRQNFYRQMAKSKIISASSTASLQTASKSLFKLNGLVLSKMFSDLLGVLFLIRHHIKSNSIHLKNMNKKRVLVNAKKYDHFPKFQAGATFINYLSQYLPIYLFPYFYSPEVAGFYALSFRILMIPTTLVGGSVRSVYYQKASSMYANRDKIYPLYKKTTFGLLKLYLLPVIIVLLFGKEIFIFIFGQNWGISGEIAKIMVFVSLFSFLNIPSVMTFNILSLQKLQFKLQFLQFFLRAIAIAVGFYLFNSYMASILLYSLAAVGNNIFLIYYINRKLSLEKL